MPEPIMSIQAEGEDLTELLWPDLLVDGAHPEKRVVYWDISWERYLALDRKLGHDRSNPHLFYLDGELEIMSTSKRHELLKKTIAGLLELFFDHARIQVIPHGHATMRDQLRSAGAEPDESWSIGEEKKYADLVLEVALSSGGIPKLSIYKRFSIPEVWFWRGNHLEIFILNEAGDYERKDASKFLESLDVRLFERCVAIPDWSESRRAFRAGLTE